jgi:hypothetical protein
MFHLNGVVSGIPAREGNRLGAIFLGTPTGAVGLTMEKVKIVVRKVDFGVDRDDG